MSHYPTTAELAAFRRDEARITFGTLDPNEYDPSTLAYRVLDSVTRSLYPGAWPDERRDGIGLGPEPWDGAEDRWGSNVRREASALRSRASARIFGDGVTWPEQTTFAPEPYGEDTLSCDVCGHFECVADLTPDWNGETGAHLSCERAAR